MDFDKGSWQEDVNAFRETSRSLGIPVAVDRSRSGNGGHAWFFFTEQVKAATARTFGCYLITETMSRRHQLSMESYDRLFPSQDTMPRGGFGNLIALPLQAEPRKAGNSVFIDDEFVPYQDQWAYLASLQRLAPQEVQTIADKAVRQGKVVGLRLPSDDEEEQVPWELPPSGHHSSPMRSDPILFLSQTALPKRSFCPPTDSAGDRLHSPRNRQRDYDS